MTLREATALLKKANQTGYYGKLTLGLNPNVYEKGQIALSAKKSGEDIAEALAVDGITDEEKYGQYLQTLANFADVVSELPECIHLNFNKAA
jgi:hypothetical protein